MLVPDLRVKAPGFARSHRRRAGGEDLDAGGNQVGL